MKNKTKYEKIIMELEQAGCTTSEAQSIVDLESVRAAAPVTQTCDNCRERVIETYYVKFPAVDYDQEQDFCRPCTNKFHAWKARLITIQELFDKNFKLDKKEGAE